MRAKPRDFNQCRKVRSQLDQINQGKHYVFFVLVEFFREFSKIIAFIDAPELVITKEPEHELLKAGGGAIGEGSKVGDCRVFFSSITPTQDYSEGGQKKVLLGGEGVSASPHVVEYWGEELI